MALSMARTNDLALIEHVQEIKDLGADVSITTTQDGSNPSGLVRQVTISWLTHNSDGRLLG